MRSKLSPVRLALLASAFLGSMGRVSAAPPELPRLQVEFSALGPAQRAALPGATIVRFGARNVSIATLLAEHQARLARFQQAAGLGRALSTPSGPIANRTFQFHVLTIPGSRSTPVPVLASGLFPKTIADPNRYQSSNGDVWHIAADYTSFCRAALATICLYLPSGSPLTSFRSDKGVNYAEDIDPFIDSSTCTGLNGFYLSASTGCELFYPVEDQIHFTPPPANEMTIGGKCSGGDGFDGTVDSHGYVDAKYGPIVSATIGTPLTLSSVTTCVIDVTVPPGYAP